MPRRPGSRQPGRISWYRLSAAPATAASPAAEPAWPIACRTEPRAVKVARGALLQQATECGDGRSGRFRTVARRPARSVPGVSGGTWASAWASRMDSRRSVRIVGERANRPADGCPRAAHDRIDAIAVADRVVQPLQDQGDRTLPRMVASGQPGSRRARRGCRRPGRPRRRSPRRALRAGASRRRSAGPGFPKPRRTRPRSSGRRSGTRGRSGWRPARPASPSSGSPSGAGRPRRGAPRPSGPAPRRRGPARASGSRAGPSRPATSGAGSCSCSGRAPGRSRRRSACPARAPTARPRWPRPRPSASATAGGASPPARGAGSGTGRSAGGSRRR